MAVYYKHENTCFFQVGAFLVSRQVSQLPLLATEIDAFGLPFYFISGLAYEAMAFSSTSSLSSVGTRPCLREIFSLSQFDIHFR